MLLCHYCLLPIIKISMTLIYIFEYIESDNIDVELLRLLIAKGLEINSCKNGINIVEKYATTSNPNVDVFKLLLDQGIPMCSNVSYGLQDYKRKSY
ncbi:hypothetical protein FGHELIBC_00022 [Camelpox virus]|uniref:Ankyrin repeat protein n=1 Tax=Camelpox virus TaxID=28873 RepID=A0A4Y5N0Q5_9POXV|nr:hypothetical protein FGHELIBC_00022 [Camelpox virus]